MGWQARDDSGDVVARVRVEEPLLTELFSHGTWMSLVFVP